MKDFSARFPNFRVKAILADAFYGAKEFADEVEKIYPKSQFISQLKSNQLVVFNNKKINLKKYFGSRTAVSACVLIRGEVKKIEYKFARLKVSSHGEKRVVIALRYEGEEEYRYLYATRLAWGAKDIITTYEPRWLVEVFFQDCKEFEGLGKLQLLDIEGSERAVTLSLLFDCSLFFHENQVKLIEDKLSACTVGSLLRKCRVEAFVFYVKDILLSSDPMSAVAKMEEGVRSIYELRISKKHMVGKDLGQMDDQDDSLCEAESPIAA